MAATKPTADVDICNLALSLLKEAPITSIDDPESKAEETCAQWYHPTRRECLRSHPWKFAATRDQLAPLSSYEPPFGYDVAFAVPTDFIRLIALGDDLIENLGQETYQIEDGYLLVSEIFTADTSVLNIRYVYDITNVSQFDALFLSYFVVKLAIRMGPSFNASGPTMQALREELRELKIEGKSVDGQDRPPTRIRRSRILDRRRGAGRRSTAGPYEIIG